MNNQLMKVSVGIIITLDVTNVYGAERHLNSLNFVPQVSSETLGWSVRLAVENNCVTSIFIGLPVVVNYFIWYFLLIFVTKS